MKIFINEITSISKLFFQYYHFGNLESGIGKAVERFFSLEDYSDLL